RATLGEGLGLAGDAQRDERRTDDLRMDVRDRGARGTAVVLEDADVRRRLAQDAVALEHHLHRARGVVGGELVERGVVLCGLDDHLVMFGGGELVGEDADAPRVAVARNFRRRLRLRAGAEWAGRAFVDVGPLAALRREDDGISGDRRLADHERSSLRASANRCAMPKAAKTT